jgi:preprotein translocase subunit SecY
MDGISNLYKKIFFSLFVLCVYRFGSYIPIAGINSFALEELVGRNESGILGMLNVLSGGSLGRMSIFALAIMPYITASIIMQLLTMSYKPLENLKKEGESGRRQIAQYSRYLTILLAAFQAYSVASGLVGFKSTVGPIVIISALQFKVVSVITLVVGTIFLMWLGEQISVRGIGNGTSLIIFVGIITGFPAAMINSFDMVRKGVISPFMVILMVIILIAMIGIIVFFERSQRRILVQYPKRQVGNKVYGGDSTHIPLKLNTSGVIPPIFASAILLFPLTAANLSSSDSDFWSSVLIHLGHGKPLFIVLYISLIIFFSFFYTSVVFNPVETAENLRKYGAYIPGRRPGSATSDYFDYVLTRLTVIGSLYLSFVCLVPELLIGKISMSFALGGTSLLIVVNVVMDTLTQIQTHLFSGKYKKLVQKMQIKERRS